MDRKQRGKDAEQLAESFLINQGLKPLTCNYHCRFGEIDLIMMDNSTLVFIEVRYRKSALYGGAAASVTPKKQAKLIKTAQIFLAQQPQLWECNCRFDLVAFEEGTRVSTPIWYKDAFST